jgi:hypothetical protein
MGVHVKIFTSSTVHIYIGMYGLYMYVCMNIGVCVCVCVSRKKEVVIIYCFYQILKFT